MNFKDKCSCWSGGADAFVAARGRKSRSTSGKSSSLRSASDCWPLFFIIPRKRSVNPHHEAINRDREHWLMCCSPTGSGTRRNSRRASGSFKWPLVIVVQNGINPVNQALSSHASAEVKGSQETKGTLCLHTGKKHLKNSLKKPQTLTGWLIKMNTYNKFD